MFELPLVTVVGLAAIGGATYAFVREVLAEKARRRRDDEYFAALSIRVELAEKQSAEAVRRTKAPVPLPRALPPTQSQAGPPAPRTPYRDTPRCLKCQQSIPGADEET